MFIDNVVSHVRNRVDAFDQRVAGAIQFEAARDSAHLELPAAYVIATGDDAGENQIQNGTLQTITDRFDVVVALRPDDDRGQAATADLHMIRQDLLRALVGWPPADDYEPIEYEGCDLLLIDRARVFYRFSFSSNWTLDTAETWQGDELSSLPAFSEVDITIDAMPPDGKIEAHARIYLTDQDDK